MGLDAGGCAGAVRPPAASGANMATDLPVDGATHRTPPVSPLVEATVSLVQDLVRAKLRQSGQSWEAFKSGGSDQLLSVADFAAVEARILGAGHRFAWSAGISVDERPEAYRPREGAQLSDAGFAHPDAPRGDADEQGRALRGVGDNVVRQERDVVGVARYVRTNERVLSYLTDGVPPGTIAVIDDSGGTLTAPIIEQFAGVICAGGTVRSHLGILTREYSIPCLMNAKVGGIKEGDRIMIESSAAAKTTEDYQRGVERTARIWLLGAAGEGAK
jgi:phosphohistidine swiveling domain-containing protein